MRKSGNYLFIKKEFNYNFKNPAPQNFQGKVK